MKNLYCTLILLIGIIWSALGQPTTQVMDDLAFVIESPANREEIITKMEQFHKNTQVSITITTFFEQDVYTANSLKAVAQWLDQQEYGISIIITVADGNKAFLQCEIQLTDATKALLSPEELQQIQTSLMEYYFRSTPIPTNAYTSGLLAGLDAMENKILTSKERLLAEVEGNVSQGAPNSEEVRRGKYLKFIIAETDYPDSDSYYTMYTGDELEIKVVQTDSVARDLSGITWDLEGVRLTPDRDDPTLLRFELNKSRLPQSNNTLVVADNLGNKISKLKIKTYRGPEIVFDEKATYNGEYLFDHGYEFAPLGPDYATFPIGPNRDTYYTPVLGILSGKHATIRLNTKQLKAEASKDANFSVVIKPSRPGFVSIDNMDSIVLNAASLNSTSSIIVKALRSINSVSLDSISINAYVSATREKVGKMEFYCADRVNKRVKLIYVKYSDESSYPSYLNAATFETFLDDQVMNQLFLDYTILVDSIASNYTTSQMQKWTKQEILDSLNIEYHGTDNPAGYGGSDDYFYITNLSVPGSKPNTYLGAFHTIGAPGGVQCKYRTSTSGETAQEAAAHEFGHWLGMPHTFESNQRMGRIVINSTVAGTRDNYMDYNIRRKKWFRRQLLHYIR